MVLFKNYRKIQVEQNRSHDTALMKTIANFYGSRATASNLHRGDRVLMKGLDQVNKCRMNAKPSKSKPQGKSGTESYALYKSINTRKMLE